MTALNRTTPVSIMLRPATDQDSEFAYRLARTDEGHFPYFGAMSRRGGEWCIVASSSVGSLKAEALHAR